MNKDLFNKIQGWFGVGAMVIACLYFPYLILQGGFKGFLNIFMWIGSFGVAIFLLWKISPKFLRRVMNILEKLSDAYLKFAFNTLLLFLPLYAFSWLSNWMVSLEIFWLQALSLSLWGLALLISIRVLLYEDKRLRLFKWLKERISGVAPWAYSFSLIWIGVFFFSSLTYILVENGKISFALSGTSMVSRDSLLNFYMWHFLKAIPGFAVTDTLRWKEPLNYDSSWVGLLLLLFKILVISPIIGTFVWYWRYIGREDTSEVKQRRVRKTVHRTYRPKRNIVL